MAGRSGVDTLVCDHGEDGAIGVDDMDTQENGTGSNSPTDGKCIPMVD